MNDSSSGRSAVCVNPTCLRVSSGKGHGSSSCTLLGQPPRETSSVMDVSTMSRLSSFNRS